MTESDRIPVRFAASPLPKKLAYYLDCRSDEADLRRGGPGGRAAEVAGTLRDIALLRCQDAMAAQRQAGDTAS